MELGSPGILLRLKTKEPYDRRRRLKFMSDRKKDHRSMALLLVPILQIVCALLVALLFPALDAFAASSQSHLSSDPRVQHAATLVEQGRYAEALDTLRPLAPDHPDQTDVRFLLGLGAIGAAVQAGTEETDRNALLDEAIAALRAILIDSPGLVRVRLELARAFFLNKQDNLSRRHFELVLASQPPPAVASNIRRFLQAMRVRRRWSGSFGVSIAPDTNINFASDAELFYIGTAPLLLSAGSRASSGLGVVVWGGSEYQYPLGNRLRLRTGIDGVHREYGGKGFDQTFVGGHVGPRWFAGENTEVSLLATANQRLFGGKRYSHDFGTRFEVEHRFASRLTANGWASWHQRQHRAREFLDGPLTVLSVGATYLPMPTVQTRAMVGYMRQHSKAVVWRNDGFWTRLGASFALPRGFTLGGSADLLWPNYEGRWAPFTPDGSSRRDRIRVLRASVFNRAFTVYGFSPQLVLVHEVRESNAQLYDYKRTRAELQFVRQF